MKSSSSLETNGVATLAPAGPIATTELAASSASTSLRFAKLLLGFVVLFLSVSACSTAPEPVEEVTTRRNQAAEYAEIGNSYYDRAQYEQALRFFELALAESRAVDSVEGIVSALNSIGSVYLAQGEVETAEEYLQSAYERATSLGPSRELVESASTLGELKLRVGSAEDALEYLKSAAEMSRSLENPERTAIVLHNLGAVYSRAGRLAEAEARFREALEMNLDGRYLGEAASNYYMLASVASKRGDLEQAREYLLAALDLDKQMERSLGIAKDLKALGIIHQKLQDHRAAYGYFSRALQVFLVLGVVEEVSDVLGELAESAERTGRTAEAEAFRSELSRLE